MKPVFLSDFHTTHSGGEFEGFDKLHTGFQWGGLGGGIRHFIDGKKGNDFLQCANLCIFTAALMLY